MKSRVLITFGLASVVVLFGSFMVREKEEALKPSVDYYLLQDRGFTSFISNLQKMEALVYVPKSKLADAKALNLALVPKAKAIVLNKQLAGSGANYSQVYPSDSNFEEVTLNFEKIDMVCYVSGSSSSSDNWKMADQFKFKWEPGNSFLKVESVSFDASRPEELQIKWEGVKTSQTYVPVTIIEIPTRR
jgi:hypothetical protein